MNAPGQRYNAYERRWVKLLLAMLTRAERLEYERRCAARPARHRRFYDDAKAEIAEQVRLDSARHTGAA